MKSFIPYLICFLLIQMVICIHSPLHSQTSREPVSIHVSPESADWSYRVGDSVKFDIAVFKYGKKLKDVTLRYEIMAEKMPVRDSGVFLLSSGDTAIHVSGMKEPGFLRCHIYLSHEGVGYTKYGTAAFEPEKIEAYTQMPADFKEFWESQVEKMETIPLDLTMEPVPEANSELLNVYHVSFNNIKGRIYGILCIPSKPGKYPALLRVPGAGIRSYEGEIERARKGMITLYIGIHGIPVNLDEDVYSALSSGALSDYKYFNIFDREEFYYHRVLLGCLRAVDVIHSLPQFNSNDLLIYGGSQGGALSIMTASLDPRIKYLAVFYPAMCDLSAYNYGRAGGWPHLVNRPWSSSEGVMNTLQYYDVVNFARFLKIPGIFSWGFNDHVCPPSSMFAAYNQIKSEKTLYTVPDTQHFRYPEQQAIIDEWILKKLKIQNNLKSGVSLIQEKSILYIVSDLKKKYKNMNFVPGPERLFCIFFLFVILYVPVHAGTEDSNCAATCYASFNGDTLIIGNGIIARKFLFSDGDLRTHSFIDFRTGNELFMDCLQPDFYLPGSGDLADPSTVSWQYIEGNSLRSCHLAVTMISRYDSVEVKRVFSVFPDCPVIRCEVYLKGNYSGEQVINLKKKRFESSYIERMAPSGPHWRLKVIEFFDETDNNNNLVRSTESLPFTRHSEYRGNLIFASNLIGGNGFFVLKESPAWPAQINYPGFDFQAGITENHHLDLRVTGMGFENSDLRDDDWIRIYGFATGLTSGDWSRHAIDLRIYQQKIRPGNLNDDEMIMMNTWGDRGQDGKISEQFILKELVSAEKLGITHFQIDDGWQVGRTKNSIHKGGSLEGIWEKDDYWEIDIQKFPHGFKNVIRTADSLNLKLGLWFNPSTDNGYENWEKDAEIVLNLYRKYHIKYFKIDGVIIEGKKAELNFTSFLNRVHKKSSGEIVINLDVTGVAPRPGYHFLNEYGNIFLANRYTDWGNYYPHWTLRNIWQLSHYIPPEVIQLEFLNPWRSSEKYNKSDPLAPQNIPFQYQFAITMIAQPLAWFEATGLPDSAFGLAPLIYTYRLHMDEIHNGVILPIGNEPDGTSWSGFQSIGESGGYLLVYREFNDSKMKTLSTHIPAGKEVRLESIAGDVVVHKVKETDKVDIVFDSRDRWSFGLFRYHLTDDNQ